MKKLIFLIAMLITANAYAGTREVVLLNLSSTGTGSAYRVPGNVKSVSFAGLSTSTATRFRSNVPGTATLQTAPSANGPWVTAKDVANTAVTNAAAASSTFNLLSAYQWFRVTFTKTADSPVGKGWAKVWITSSTE